MGSELSHILIASGLGFLAEVFFEPDFLPMDSPRIACLAG